MGIRQARPRLTAVWIRRLPRVEELKMATESIVTQPRDTEEEKRRAEEDQAQLDRIRLFRKERRRRRRRRVIAVTTVTAAMLLTALTGWHLRERGSKATLAASQSSPAVAQPIASPVLPVPPVPIGKARAQIGNAATPPPAPPSVSHEKKPAAKLPRPARAPSKAVKRAQAPVPPPKFLDRPHSSHETPVVRAIDQPPPATMTLPPRRESSPPRRTLPPAL